MVSAKPNSMNAEAIAEKRVSLHDVSWQTYETILAALGENRAAHLTYHNGTLEIMSPLEAHENSSGLMGQFIEILTEELNLNIKTLGSTTLNRPELKSGAEPDQCYYIAHEPQVRGRPVDLSTDPPPDLVIEVDITHTDINKNALYAAMGIPEFWRYDGRQLSIYQLQAQQYQEVALSPTFPSVPKEIFYQFLTDCAQQGETAAKRNLRAWSRQQS
jgi:Uma2 family endonuclease